jgi:hypothetical protein
MHQKKITSHRSHDIFVPDITFPLTLFFWSPHFVLPPRMHRPGPIAVSVYFFPLRFASNFSPVTASIFWMLAR